MPTTDEANGACGESSTGLVAAGVDVEDTGVGAEPQAKVTRIASATTAALSRYLIFKVSLHSARRLRAVLLLRQRRRMRVALV